MTDRLAWLGMRSGQILLILALAAAIVFGLVQLELVVVPVIVALILASALSPVVNWLRKAGIPAALATWITLLACVAVFGGIITGVVFAVQSQWDELTEAVSDGIDRLQEFLANGPISISQDQLDGARKSAVDFLTSRQFGSGALAGVSTATELITGVVLVVVVLYFFLEDGKRIWSFLLRPFAGERLERGRRIGDTTVNVLGGYVRGTVIIALVDGAAVGIGLAILQVPLAVPLAVIVFLGAFIPLVGAVVAGILAILVTLVTNGPLAALITALIVVGVSQLEGNFLQPVVMSQSVKLHPLVILLALTAGTVLGGIIGAVLAVPIAAVAWAIAKIWNVPKESS